MPFNRSQFKGSLAGMARDPFLQSGQLSASQLGIGRLMRAWISFPATPWRPERFTSASTEEVVDPLAP